MKAALIFGTATGNTEAAAELIADAFKPELDLPMLDVARLSPADLAVYDFIIAAVPTWNIGELESGWQDLVEKLPGTDLSKTHIAIVGMGDQFNYADTYQDGMGILYKALEAAGAQGKIGFTDTEGHNFEASAGVFDDRFCGLALDDDNQAELTEERIANWAAQVKEEIKAIATSA